MWTNLLLTVALVMLLLSMWVGIQAWARRTAAQHPEAGPYREAGGGCGGGCGGCASACDSPAGSPREASRLAHPLNGRVTSMTAHAARTHR